jgi:hypothetical protein
MSTNAVAVNSLHKLLPQQSCCSSFYGTWRWQHVLLSRKYSCAAAAAAAAVAASLIAHPIIQSVLPRRYFTISHGAKFMMAPFPSVFAKSAATAESGWRCCCYYMPIAGCFALEPPQQQHTLYLHTYGPVVRLR